MSSRSYDFIVAGVGGVGSAALFELARRGSRVVGIDRFSPGHDRGSSHGQSRIIRLAYFEHPDYVPLLRRAYARWGDLEVRSGERLFIQAGLLQVGPEGGELIRGVLSCARLHGLDVEKLDAATARERFPGFAIPDGLCALLDREAGLLRVESCVKTHVREATKLGADLCVGETVLSWRAERGAVEVETDRARYRAGGLLLTPGPWAPQLLTEVGIPFELRRKSVFWFASDAEQYTVEAGCPTFLFELGDRAFYGFPALEADGVKVAEHTGGRSFLDPLAIDRRVDPEEAKDAEAFVRQHLPGVQGPLTRHEVCIYTMTPDGHFVVGMHPGQPEVVFAAGLSGHGFKFAGVLAEAVADLASSGSTELPIEFLSPLRFGTRR